MKNTSDVLIVSFDSGLSDISALCVNRKCGEEIVMLKMEVGEQADILYHLLTEQTAKAEIKAESELHNKGKREYMYHDAGMNCKIYKCLTCGYLLKESDNFCSHCGADVKGE